ncbi:hypothetical protein [Oleiagrimonas soli]|uniref:Uncharacterized protein n=1 Tax=Oleiagrimonas soli TaxID=1543381 RepID=A0A099CWR4_9GAMM|nr:hypothetical protein [Oleiagrimonas soli]KGI78101.1 hypothetical protein LF63_0107010 [Oleiagrimonas soli]MBB6183468.1 hypothetical protein [Oleiagrimonas soli]
MNLERTLIACLACLTTAPALAQSASHKPLNLELPPSSIPAASSTAPAHATSAPAHATSSASSQPGVYYGDTSGRVASDTQDDTPSCDDSTYNQPQVHGSVGAGVMAGSHMSGSYQSGRVNLSQAFGDCDHPRGGMSISIGVSQGHFDGPHERR